MLPNFRLFNPNFTENIDLVGDVVKKKHKRLVSCRRRQIAKSDFELHPK
jgi:hypothetical protein